MSFGRNVYDRFNSIFQSLTNANSAMFPRKDRAAQKTFRLRLEELEKRELLSVEPILTGALVAATPEQESIVVATGDANDSELVVLSEQDMSELTSSSVLDDELAAKLSSSEWTAGKRWFYYDDGFGDGGKDSDGNWINYNWRFENNIFTLNEDGPLCTTIKDAAEAGLNGMVWKCGVDDIVDVNDFEDANNGLRAQFLEAVNVFANSEDRHIEIIPTIWAVGYGSFLDRDVNLVEGVYVENVPLKVTVKEDGGAAASFVDTTSVVEVENGDMEGWDIEGKNPVSWTPSWPNITEKDVETVNGETNTSLCITLPVKTVENEDGKEEILQNVSDSVGQTVTVTEGEYYIVSCRIKTNSAKSVPEDWHAADLVVSDPNDDKQLGWKYYDEGSTDEWIELRTERFKATSNEIVIGLRGNGAPGEKFWFDDVVVQTSSAAQSGIIMPIQRDGTPITVKAVKDGVEIEYKSVTEDNVTNWTLPAGFKLERDNDTGEIYSTIDGKRHDGEIVLEIPKGSNILKDGVTNLTVSYYTAKYNSIYSGRYYQYGVCLSEESLYKEHMTKSANIIQDVLKPQTWFLAFDEVRIGGNCEACDDTGLETAQIFGRSVSEQYKIIKDVIKDQSNSDAEIVVWSDMFDPYLNAKDDYYYVDGSLEETVNYIPNDLIIACWYDSQEKSAMWADDVEAAAQKTLEFFSSRGFRTISACYYDWYKGGFDLLVEMPTSSIDFNTEGWLTAIANNPTNNVGMFYTTWNENGTSDYRYLSSFGSALRQINNGASQITSISLDTNSPRVGQTLTTTLSHDGAGNAAATYQWYRKDYALVDEQGNPVDSEWLIWKEIDGATGSTYDVQSADKGKSLKVVAVGIGDYAGTVSSAETDIVTDDVPLKTFAVSMSTNSPVCNVAVNATTDPKNATVSYQWSRRASTSGAWTMIPNATESSYKPTVADVGCYLKVEAVGVGDYAGTHSAQTNQRVTYTPIWSNVPNQTVVEGETFNLTVGVNPVAGLSFAYSLTSAPEGMSIDSQTGAIVWHASDSDLAPGASKDWLITVKATASANGVESGDSEKSFTLTVAKPEVIDEGVAPVFDPIAAQTTAAGETFSLTVVAKAIRTGDGGSTVEYPVRYSLGQGAPEGMTINSSGGIAWNVPADFFDSNDVESDSFAITVAANTIVNGEVSDKSASKSFMLTVTNPNYEKPGQNPPAAPSDLTLGEFNADARSISVSWKDNSDNETEFLVQYSFDGQNWSSIPAAANTQTATLTNLELDKTYTVRVAATNEVGDSAFVSGTFITASGVPAAPSDVSFGEFNVDARSISVSWKDNSSDETGFVVQYSADGFNWADASVLADETSVTLADLEFDVEYTVRVAAMNDAGSSNFVSGTFTTPSAPVAPEAPTDLTFGEFDATALAVSVFWTDNSDNENGFVVQYSTDGATWSDASTSANATSATLTQLSFNTTYTVRVAATNEVGDSAFISGTFTTPSEPNSSDLKIPVPLRLSDYNEKTGVFVASWDDDSEGEDGYLLEASTDGGATWVRIAQTGADATSAMISGLGLNGSFTVRVSAFNAADSSFYAYAQVWKLADFPSHKSFALSSPESGTVVLSGVSKDGSYTPLETSELGDFFQVVVLGRSQLAEDLRIDSSAAYEIAQIDFVDSVRNNTITVDGANEGNMFEIGSETVETTEHVFADNPYEKILARYARQFGEDSRIYQNLKTVYDEAFARLTKIVKTTKATWGVISIDSGADVRFIGAQTATVNGGAGEDYFKIDSMRCNYVVTGDAGGDTLIFVDAAKGINVDLGLKNVWQAAILGDGGLLKLTDEFETIYGSYHNDRIVGSAKGATVIGNGDSDSIILVGGENSVVLHDKGQSVIARGSGSYDILLSDAPNSTVNVAGVRKDSSVTVEVDGDRFTLIAGPSAFDAQIDGDYAIVNGGAALQANVDIIGDYATVTTGQGADSVRIAGDYAIANVGAGSDAVEIVGANANVALGLGDDVLTVSDGASGRVGGSFVNAGAGNDFVYLAGASGKNYVNAGAGNDVVVGGSGADEIYGIAGVNVLLGMRGADRIYGGAGRDLIVAAQPVKVEEIEKDDSEALARFYADLYEGWVVENDLEATLNLVGAQIEPDGDKDSVFSQNLDQVFVDELDGDLVNGKVWKS